MVGDGLKLLSFRSPIINDDFHNIIQIKIIFDLFNITIIYIMLYRKIITYSKKLFFLGLCQEQKQNGVGFKCPEEFGYYPHPNDCSQYYVCVFGGALLESCTGGLMYR